VTLHIVKHLGTGQTLSIERGSSWWEGQNTNGTVRIFKNEHAAKSFISSWVRGRAALRYGYTDRFGGEIETMTLEFEDVGRTKDMLVAIPVQIVELNERKS
jgi:hypothetical protein